MSKRRFIDLLPPHLKTDDLRKFFAATIDQVFQPGRAEPLSGYIGQYPPYYDAAKDFYIGEPTTSRQFHQLEPAMAVTTASAIDRVLFYEDLVNYLRANGGNVSDHSRLFENDYYSWSPPVDLDKLNNFQQYYWFDNSVDDAGATLEQPYLVLVAPYAAYTGDGSTASFDLPDALEDVSTDDEHPVVLVNNMSTAFTRAEDQLTLAVAPAIGAEIAVYRYGDLKKLIVEKTAFDPYPLLPDDHKAKEMGVHALTSGMRVQFVDGVNTMDTYYVDGVGQGMALSPYATTVVQPFYALIDRRSRDGNFWSRHNRWVHHEAVAWSQDSFADQQAKRPIIEFNHDLELWRYGRRHITAIDRVLTGAVYIALGWDGGEWDSDNFDDKTPITIPEIIGQKADTVVVDFDEHLEMGQRVLIATTVAGRPDLSQRIMLVVPVFNDDGDIVMALVPEEDAEAGDIVSLRDTGHEYHFDGEIWHESQMFVHGDAPLFNLYDGAGVVLDDSSLYPDSTFAGNRLFGYAPGTGRADAVLGTAIRHDTVGQIIFENDISTRRVYNGDDEITGFYYFRRVGDPDTWSNDWHLVDTPTTQTHNVANDVFSIPRNLQANPENDVVTFISRGGWFDHFNSIMTKQDGFSGVPYNVNNWRDLSVAVNCGDRILQHRAPLLRTMLLSGEPTYDYLNAVRFVDQEYARFKNRFVQKVMEFYADGKFVNVTTPAARAQSVLDAMKIGKTSDFAFALSRMAGGQNFIPPTGAYLGVMPVYTPGIEIDDTYGEPVAFLRGHDGSRTALFGERKSFIYNAGDNPVFVMGGEPQGELLVTINGVETTNYVLAGSLVRIVDSLADGDEVRVEVEDIRDTVLLALERLIHTNIDESFRTENQPTFHLHTYTEGKFRPYAVDQHNYRLSEIANILAPTFLRWSQINQLDFRSNATFDAADPFTWNYRSSKDRDGTSVPCGHWRGIYRWYFDTDRPHLAPWEMLGFADQPDWWEDEYGAAPYTRDNSKLWEDLRDGKIADGPRQGVDPRYVRAQLLSVIPVDENGDLLDPVACQIIPVEPPLQLAKESWQFGDGAPVEALWRNSSSFAFAQTIAAFLMKPARWVETGWDTLNNRIDHGDQWVHGPTNDRAKLGELSVHGEVDEQGQRRIVFGIQQWISEHMISKGQAPKLFGDAMRGLTVRLAHKMAGFTTPENLRVLADNFGIVPDEDVNVILHTSPSQREEFYSGVLVEWTGQSWRVFGYDASNPYFLTIPGDPEGPSMTIRINDEPTPIVVEWRPNVFYKNDTYVEYQGSTYRAIKTHTSTTTFEQSFWKAEPGVLRPTTPTIEKFLSPLQTTRAYPYGTEFFSLQEVGNFLFDHERYLVSRGWVFDNTTETGEPQDWTRAVRDLLNWALFKWSPGNFIALSPGAEKIKFSTDHGMVYSLEQAFKGVYGVVDRAGMPIDRKDTFVTRLDGEVTMSTRNSDLFGVRLSVGEIEHALVFSNQTIFGDTIYNPLLDLRQPRLRLIGQRARDWNGRVDAPGYVLVDNKITPNFDKAAEDIRNAFEIEGSDNKVLRDHARHLIGFESRDYFEKLLLSDTQQFEFYQGMIKQKGAPDVFNKMMRSQFIGAERQLKFLEEWAFKDGSYGATESKRRISFDFFNSDVKRSPQAVRFFNGVSTPDLLQLGSERYVEDTDNHDLFFRTRVDLTAPGDMPTAGYARLGEVDHTLFRIDGLRDLYNNLLGNGGGLFDGERVWVYEMENRDWNVLRSFELSTTGASNLLKRIEVAGPFDDYSGARLYFRSAHGLSAVDAGLHIIVDGDTRTRTDLSGVHKIVAVGTEWIEIETSTDEGYVWYVGAGDPAADDVADDPEDAPTVRVLRPTRFASLGDLQAASWMARLPGELAYVETPQGWIVYQWDGANWAVARRQPQKMDTASITSALVYDHNTRTQDGVLVPEPLAVERLLVFDPVMGLIPGQAERELAYKIEYDPARYNRGNRSGVESWGADQLGTLWWDVSAVRFLQAETDVLPVDVEFTPRQKAEIEHRAATWGRIAPGTSVDVYEWTRSAQPPAEWRGEGDVYSVDDWAEAEEYDPYLKKMTTQYYFWVKNVRTIPTNTPVSRKMSAYNVARLIESPTALDLPWVAAIARDTVIVSGVSQFLNDASTIVQIEVSDVDYDGEIHTEWTLVRPGDDRSLPSDALWSKLVDSVIGMDVDYRPVPDVSLHASVRQGVSVRPRQSLFSTPSVDPRASVLAARESMVGMINRIFARGKYAQDRSSIGDAMTVRDTWGTHSPTDNTDYLTWTSESGDHVHAPSPLEYAFEVFSAAERDALVIRDELKNAVAPVRVFLNRMADTSPQWSVWEYDPSNPDASGTDDERLAKASSLFTLAKAYDTKVTSMSARNVLTPSAGDRVLVAPTLGFWSLWLYDPTSNEADANGYVCLRMQNYDTGDFFHEVDWYADGYSAAHPPIISYQTPSAMRLAEGPSPSNTFVRIAIDSDKPAAEYDETDLRWAWLVYKDGVWQHVAREKGTYALRDYFYDPSRPVYGADGKFNSALIKNRDGSLELRAILKALRDGALTDAEINELFFSMVHFAHAHVDQVNWAFKTSFMHVSGFNERLAQTPVQEADNTDALLAYIDEVKPYRVKTREFSRTLSPPDDLISVHVGDFDKPVYLDPTSGYRPLKLNTGADRAILETAPWSEWYNEYQSEENKVRKITTRVFFDRIDTASVYNPLTKSEVVLPSTLLVSSDARMANSVLGAGTKIDTYYTPTSIMAEKNLEALLDLDFRGSVLDGDKIANRQTLDVTIKGDMGNAVEVGINPTVNGQPGLRINDPHWDENRPQELMVMGHHDGVVFTVRQSDRAFRVASVLPGKAIMHPLMDGDWDVDMWDDSEWDDGEAFQTGTSPLGTRVLHHMDGGWEFMKVEDIHSSILATDLDMGDATVTLARSSAADAVSVKPFLAPQPDAPGVIWIGAERVEYSRIVEDVDGYTLSGVRRGTKGSATGVEERLSAMYDGDGASTIFTLSGATNQNELYVTLESTGARRTLIPLVDYTVVYGSGVATVTLTVAPETGTKIFVTQTNASHVHRANTAVVGMASPFDEPSGGDLGSMSAEERRQFLAL